MYTLKTTRRAIAMIELIFAIVIMGIVLLSVPNLLLQSQKGSLVTLQQEAIAMAASHANALMTYAWDENNTDNVATYINNKLTVNAGNDLLQDINISALLLFPSARQRRFVTTAPIATASSTLGKEGANFDDIDDYKGITRGIISVISGVANNAADIGEYIDVNISQATDVIYGNDTASYGSAAGVFSFSNPWGLVAPAGTSNIKLIETNLTTNAVATELEKNIKLRAFMCNIGTNRPRFIGGF